MIKYILAIFLFVQMSSCKQCYRETIKETDCDKTDNVIRKAVAFSAYMSDGFVVKHSRSLKDKQTFIFDQTETNTEHAYNKKTGVFTVPVTGTYAFTWTICADSRVNDGGLGEFGSQLMTGNRVVGAVHAESEKGGDDDCATGFVIKFVNKGTSVYLRNIYTHQGALLSKTNQTRSTFSGWKLD